MTPLATLRRRPPGIIDRPLAIDARIAALLDADAVVALGVSGGKDSVALAIAVVRYLRAIGHRGPVVMMHADLGRVEWRDSLPTCERLSAHLSVELVVARREQGDMMDRWLQRWRDNMRRYAELECVRAILPWSTPSMRFCTSELKTKVMCAALARRFPGRTIISACGIRREESPDRAKAEISKVQPELEYKTLATNGVDWNPILEWTEADVRALAAAESFPLHEGYILYGMSRISCAFCIMGSGADLVASASCADNQAVYREMVDLEIASTFAFQGSRWLGDVAPHLLTDEQRAGLARAKVRAVQREVIEAEIPDHLLYERGWPKVMPTDEEAVALCAIRRHVAEVLGIEVKYTEPAALLARYAELIVERKARDAAKAAKEARRVARLRKKARAARKARPS